MRPAGALLFLLFCLIVGSAEVGGQVVRVEGGRGERAVRLLETAVQRGDLLFLDRDTTLGPGFHTPGDLLVWDSDVRLEGSVGGDVVVLGGVLFVRPGARIGGRAVSIRGAVLGSARAEVGERVELGPSRPVVFQREADTLIVRILPPPPAPLVSLPGVAGLRRISYDRVDGLSVGWGPRIALFLRDDGPTLDAWATLRSARGRIGGGTELRVPLFAGIELVGRAERATLTADDWIRGDLSNSLSVLVGGHDARDYHESDRLGVALRRRHAALVAGELGIEPFVSFVTSSDRSLESQAPWTLRGRTRVRRENPPITETRIRSAQLGTRAHWIGGSSDLSLQLAFEHAPEQWSDVAFSRYSGDLGFRTAGLWNDDVRVRAHVRGTTDETPLPPQRWTHVGGSGTLPTLSMAAHRGDQLVYLETIYALGLPFIGLPIVGSPALRATFATGTAWLTGTSMPSWEQNLGFGFEASYLVVQLFVDPRIPRPRPTFQLELTLP